MNADQEQRIRNLIAGLTQAGEHLAKIHGELTSALTVAATLLARVNNILVERQGENS